MKEKIYILLISAILSISALSGCSSQSTLNTAESEDDAALSADTTKSWVFDQEDLYTELTPDTVISLNGTDAQIDGKGAELDNGAIMISSSGVYELTGTFSGNVTVSTDKDSEVRLLLNNAEINSDNGPAVYIKQCGKVTVSTLSGSVNQLSDSSEYTLEEGEDEPDSALFSKSDLVLNGLGTLSVSGVYKNGIKSKDNLIVTGGTVQIIASGNGLVGRDVLAVTDAVIEVECGADALKTTNSDESEAGELYIEGGTLSIDADEDGIDSANAVYLNSGDITINTGEGSQSVSKKYTGEFKRNDSFDMDTETEQDAVSQKGIKAENIVSISGGQITADSADDSIHSNAAVYISGGNFQLSSGDDGVHADSNLEISGGMIDVLTCYEGLEGFTIDLSGGDIHVNAEDDGLNAAGTSSDTKDASMDTWGAGSRGTDGCNITISGGYVFVDADGDGIDSNDSVSITGGTVVVNGPTNNGNGSLDFENLMVYDGGTILLSGSSGMLQTPGSTSKAYSITLLLSSAQAAGKGVVLATSDGEPIAAVAPDKEYSSMTIGSELIENGKEYKLIYGAELTGESKNGVFDSYEIASSEGEITFTVSGTVTYVDENGITDQSSAGGMQGAGRDRGEAPNGKMQNSEVPSQEAPNGDVPGGEMPDEGQRSAQKRKESGGGVEENEQ